MCRLAPWRDFRLTVILILIFIHTRLQTEVGHWGADVQATPRAPLAVRLLRVVQDRALAIVLAPLACNLREDRYCISLL